MVTNTTIYTRQIYCILSTDTPDVEFRNGDEVILIDQNIRLIFDEENQTFLQIPMGGGGNGYTANDWMDLSKPEGEVSSDEASVTAYMIRGRTGVTALTIPNVTALPDNFAQGCSGLLRVTAPQVTSAGVNAFKSAGASGAASVYMPLAGINTSAFDSAKFPVVVFSRVAASASLACAFGSMTTADVTGEGAPLGYQTFKGAGSFKVLILRSSTLIVLNNVDVFAYSPFASGGSGGTLYVPQALISGYQNATNWSALLGYANNSVQAIEGSIYETQYADGTPIA